MLKKIYEIEDYISNNKELTEKLLKSTSNIYLHKEDTGMGGSSVFLKARNQKIILLQPLTGMIEGKELEYRKSKTNYFCYGKGAKNKIRESFEIIEKIGEGVITTTAEALLVYLDGKFDILKDYTIILDESDCYSITEYRSEAFYELYRLIESRKYKRLIATTATPLNDYKDIPIGIIEEVIIVKHKTPRVKPILVTNEFDQNEIISRILNGEKVVLFTNESKIYESFLYHDELIDYKIQVLAAEAIQDKLNPKTSRVDREFIFEEFQKDANIYICSTKYLIGYDVPVNAHVYIISDDLNGLTPHESKSYNEIIQAYGRIRKTVLSATLILRGTSSSYDYNKIETLYNKKLKSNEEYVEFMTELNKSLLCNTFDIDILNSILDSRGFKLYFNDAVKHINKKNIELKEQIKNLLDEEIYTLVLKLDRLLLNLEGDRQTQTSTVKFKLVLTYAIATIIKKLDIKTIDLHDFNRIVNQLYKVINDERLAKNEVEVIKHAKFMYDFEYNIKSSGKFELLNAYDKVQILIDKVISKIIETHETKEKRITISNIGINTTVEPLVVKFLNKKYKVNHLTQINHRDAWKNFDRDVKKILSKLNLTVDEYNKVIEKTNEYVNNLKSCKFFEGINNGKRYSLLGSVNIGSLSLETTKTRYITYLKFLLVKKTSNNLKNFKIIVKDNREYNPLTKVHGCLRSLVPSGHQLIDIVSANPTFIDYHIGSNIKYKVYGNIMNHFNITRKEAKIYYNSILNSILTPKQYSDFGSICGYSESETEHLVNLLNSNTKGNTFRIMTEIEKEAIELIVTRFDLKNYTRLHDAIMIHNDEEYDLSEDVSNSYLKLKLHKEF